MIITQFLISAFLMLFAPMQQEDQTLNNISAAMKAGSSKELIKYCNDNLEIKIDGKSTNYSKSRAEVVIKDFFMKNPPKNFRYIHHGSSPEGLKYTIGTYTVSNGSYRVVMLIKKVGSNFRIDTINFSRE